MAHVYHVELNNGDSYTITTDKHHEEYPPNVFLGHLLDVIKRTGAQVAAIAITRYMYRGRR